MRKPCGLPRQECSRRLTRFDAISERFVARPSHDKLRDSIMPHRQRLLNCIAATIVVATSAIAIRSVEAIGYWNVPGNVCQCVGYGNGAGHHAPLVLGPIDCRGWCDRNEVRLPYPPRATGACSGIAVYAADCGDFQPTLLERAPAPAAARPQVFR